MDQDFLRRVRKTSLLLAIFLSPMAATYLGLGFAAGWLLAVGWSLVNLILIGELVSNILVARKKINVRTAFLLLAKFPLLYAVGLLLLNYFYTPALLSGFLWPFFVATMKALGRAVLRMDTGLPSSQVVIGSAEPDRGRSAE